MTDTITTWRTLTGELTQAQITEMELFEAEAATLPASPETLVRIARSMIAANLAQIRFADIPAPADAIDTPGPWEDWGDVHQRVYTCWKHPAVPDAVQITGYQRSDGTITRSIHAAVDLEDQDASTTRAIAQALMLAAEQLDILEGVSPPFM